MDRKYSKYSYFIIILFSHLAIIQAEQQESCVIEDCPKIRTFQTLIQYQSNKRSFNPHEKTYEGNYVTFRFDSMDRLPKNSFLTLSSNNIISIDLSNKSIKMIDDGAFLFIFCLHHLDISKNQLSNLTKDMFLGLGNLRTLNICGNKIKYLYDDVFSNLKTIQTLDLSNNGIQNMDKSVFYNIPTLEKLILSNNCMKALRYIYFSDLHNLKELYLDHNELAMLPIVHFRENTFLETIDLSGNGLVIFDLNGSTDTEFRSMKSLNLSNNYLINLNVDIVKNHFPNDEFTIDLNNNQFYCISWRQYLKEFKEKHIKIAPGRNFSHDYYIDGMACDTLNSSTNNANGEDEDAHSNVDENDTAQSLNHTYNDISRTLQHKEGEMSPKRNKYKDVGIAPDKALLVDHKDDKTSESTNDSDHRTAKGVTIALAMIGAVFLILITLDYVLGIGYTQRGARRLRRYLTSSNSDDTSEYVTLTPPI